jgi:hypothetical protein
MPRHAASRRGLFVKVTAVGVVALVTVTGSQIASADSHRPEVVTGEEFDAHVAAETAKDSEQDAAITGLGARIDDLGARIDELEARVDALEEPPAEVPVSATVETAVSDGTINVNFTLTGAEAAANGATVSRDKADRNGTVGWTSPVIAGRTGSYLLGNLVNGTEYNITVQPTLNGAPVGTPKVVQATPSGPVTPPPPGPGTPGIRRSGAAGGGIDGGSTAFGDWRGTPTNSTSHWADSEAACQAQGGLRGTGPLATWNRGPAIVAIGGKWAQTWQAAATGGMDAIWTNCLNALKSGWGTRPQGDLIISLFHEANGTWYPWSVPAAQVANFKAAFARFDALQESIMPDAKIAFVVNADHIQAGYTIPQMLPAADDYDYFGVDQYSMHAHINFDQFPTIALNAGKELIVQEWGIKNDEGGGAGFVRYMHENFVQHQGTGPGKLVLENYFNLIEYRIYPSGSSPAGAAEYVARF